MAWPMPRPVIDGSTATVRTSPRSAHSTCSAPQPTTLPSILGHPELLDGLIQRHQVLFQQDLAGVGVDELLDQRGRQRCARAGSSARRPVVRSLRSRNAEYRFGARPATMQSAWRDEEERAIRLSCPVTDILLRCRGSRRQVRWSRAFGSPTSPTCSRCCGWCWCRSSCWRCSPATGTKPPAASSLSSFSRSRSSPIASTARWPATTGW